MSRHRRANSDLYGLKTLKTTKSSSFRQSQQTITNHNLSAYEPKSSTSKKSKSNCPETPTKKLQVHQLIVDTFKLLKHFYQAEDTQYFNRVKKFLNGQWQTHKKSFIQHINKLGYIEEQMQKKNFNQIQLQIVAEWRRNQVLYCIRVFWYDFISVSKFVCIEDFVKKYNIFKDFVGQLAYLYFKRFFLSLGSCKQIQKVLDKLTERTAHLIISHTTTWSKLCDKIIIPLIQQRLNLNFLQDFDILSLDLQKMQIKTIAVDINSPNVEMPKTVDSIDKFTSQYKTLQKIKLLISVRESMQQQIRNRQQKLIQEGKINGIKLLDKDDFVDCLVYCVVKGDISLQKLGVSISFFHYVLGPDAHSLLSKFRCDSYLADLEAVYDFILLEVKKILGHETENFNVKHSKALQSTTENSEASKIMGSINY